MPKILVVGAGFAGTTYAREIAEHGCQVDIIDKRRHLAGNAYDETLSDGIRVHHYGPHLFHTSNVRVVNWLKRFGTFVPYEHRVTALLPELGRLVPLPINRSTVNAVFDQNFQTEFEVKAFLRKISLPYEKPRNAGEYLYSQIGKTLTEIFFRPYTKKMWGLELEDMNATVVKRIPIRFDDEDRYFPDDNFQILPRDGYTQVVGSIVDHKKIRVELGVPFVKAMLRDYDYCFNSMPIDEYFDFVYGPLPYRSIRFHHRAEPRTYGIGKTSVINFTDSEQYTRQTDWSRFPGHSMREAESKTITLEEPCDYLENHSERYYPVKTSDGRLDAVCAKYKMLANEEPNIRFIGRCGTYQYLDMDQVINQSLQGAYAWINELSGL
jgi:UDP-galactopyranose mutase